MSEHAHRESQRCTEECPHPNKGSYRVYPDVWPQDARAIALEIQEIRNGLTRIRGRIDALRHSSNDFDSERSFADARGSVQGAIVMLYGDQTRWSERADSRDEVDARLPQIEGTETKFCVESGRPIIDTMNPDRRRCSDHEFRTFSCPAYIKDREM